MDYKPIKVVCAWCGAAVGEDPNAGLPAQFRWDEEDFAVSHGICPRCFEEQENVLRGMAPAHPHSGKAGGEG